ncbi:MAG: hypothetical protein RL345_2089 [Chloroflexota bacterium]
MRQVPLLRGLFAESATLKATVRAMPCSRVIAVVVGVIAGIPADALVNSVSACALRRTLLVPRRTVVLFVNSNEVIAGIAPVATDPGAACTVILNTLKYPDTLPPVRPPRATLTDPKVLSYFSSK